jgi:hypothetical protein
VTKIKAAGAAIALALCANPAGAAVLSQTQSVSVGGDLATDDEGRQPIYLPTFDPRLGPLQSTSLSLQGVLTWDQTFYSVANPGPLETIFTAGNLDMFDQAEVIGGFQTVQGTPYTAAYTYDVSGTLDFDVSGVLQPGDASTYVILNMIAYATCTGCQRFGTPDDVLGSFDGTLTTTFTYLPVPEPPSIIVLTMGLVGLACRKRAPKIC